ncbi:hypothetical protein GF402_07960 [Candidatus Fermentibacteria bacterium]|nr:hypothetical protein [Candidatus Fermentibacteria bacterium]
MMLEEKMQSLRPYSGNPEQRPIERMRDVTDRLSVILEQIEDMKKIVGVPTVETERNPSPSWKYRLLPSAGPARRTLAL